MKFINVNDEAFKEYGRVIKGYDLQGLLDGMMKTPCPEGTIYVAGDEKLEEIPVSRELGEGIWGFMPIQVGYCNGHNTKLNALEYHRNSEVNVAVGEDLVLLLARQQDIREDYTLDTSTVKAFLVPAGTAVEVYATSLHYAPCQTNSNGFRCVVILPKGTNYDLPKKPAVKDGEEKLMTATNKWLIGHPEGGLAEGSFLGLVGKNLDVTED